MEKNKEYKLKDIWIELENGEKIPMKDLPRKEYEDFLEFMHRFRLAYISAVSRPK